MPFIFLKKSKRTLLFFIVTIVTILGNGPSSLIYSIPQTILDLNTLTAASGFNIFVGHELKALDELSFLLDFLGQAINKGTIKTFNNTSVRRWLYMHQENIRILQEVPENLTLKHCYNLTSFVKALLLNINSALISRFTIIRFLDLKAHVMKPVPRNILLKDLKAQSLYNDTLLLNLKDKTSTIGLTTINLLARKLDSLNDQYHIVSTVKVIGGATLGALACIYLLDNKLVTPDAESATTTSNSHASQQNQVLDNDSATLISASSSFPATQNINTPQANTNLLDAPAPYWKKILFPIIAPVKKLLGDKPIYKKDSYQLENRDKLGFIGEIHHNLKDPSLTTFLGVAGTTGGYLYGRQLQTYSENIKNNLRQYWERLKGYQVPENIASRFYVEDKITLDDERLVGLDHQVNQLKDLALYITEPDMFDRQGVSLGKGILLTGPSRCGKTLTARALSGTINKILQEKGSSKSFGFMEVSFRELVYKKDGLRTLIEEARQNAPCVLFIDELHNLPLQTTGYNETLTEFLVSMSGINSENDAKHQVIMLGATNKPENIDSALLQPGRFGTIIQFGKPNYESRKHYFEVMFKRNVIDVKNFNIELLAQQTENCSYGDLEGILRDARFKARKRGKKLAQPDIQEKIYSQVYKLKAELSLTHQEKKLAATHHAGKALMHMILKPDATMIAATIKGIEPSIEEKKFWEKNNQQEKPVYGTIIRYNHNESLKMLCLENLEKEIKINLAGSLAQKELLGSIAYNYKTEDKKQALTYIKDILLEGTDENDLSKRAKDRLKEQSYELLQRYSNEVSKSIKESHDKLALLADKLAQNSTLSYQEIESIII